MTIVTTQMIILLTHLIFLCTNSSCSSTSCCSMFQVDVDVINLITDNKKLLTILITFGEDDFFQITGCGSHQLLHPLFRASRAGKYLRLCLPRLLLSWLGLTYSSSSLLNVLSSHTVLTVSKPCLIDFGLNLPPSV